MNRVEQLAGYPIGTEVTTVAGNLMRKCVTGWAPLRNGAWDRRSEYSDWQMAQSFILREVRLPKSESMDQ